MQWLSCSSHRQACRLLARRRARRVHAAVALVVALSMVFVPLTPGAAGQGRVATRAARAAEDAIAASAPDEARDAHAAPQAQAEGVPPQADPPPESPTLPPAVCSPDEAKRPESAQHILVFPEQEVGVTYEAGSETRFNYYQYDSGAMNQMGFANMAYQSDWQQSVAVDLNGDGWDETVSAYRDWNARLALRSNIWHGASYTFDTWTSNTDRLQGDQVKWIDIAAGNLLRRTGDQRDVRDVVVVTRNDEGDLELILMDGSADGGLYRADGQTVGGGTYRDPTDGRENVFYTSVAAGDLNADGYDDEIVTAFKDGGDHLQVLVLRYKDVAWHKLAGYRYSDPDTSHGADNICRSNGDGLQTPVRGLDVTTGDVEGDGKEEAIISFVDASNHLQTIVMGMTPATSGDTEYKLQEEYYYYAEEDTRDPDYVSVAAPDLNGDALAEILVAFGGRHDCCTGEAPAQVWRLSYGLWEDDPIDTHDYGLALRRDTVWEDSELFDKGVYKFAEYVSLAKVNVDEGVREKAILAFNDGLPYKDDLIGVRLLTEPGDAESLTLEAHQDIPTGKVNNWDVSAVAGDVDQDSSWLTYTNTCKKYGVSTLSTVVNMPPVWYDYSKSYLGIGAAFGTGMSGGVESSDTTTFSYGASYTIDGSASVFDLFEVGPQYGVAFEGSQAITEAEGMEIGIEQEYTTVFRADSASGLVVNQTLDYYLYRYTEDDSGDEVWVRVPVMRSEWNDVMEQWNTKQHYRGWMPVGPGPRVNLALGKPARQSSTYVGWGATNAVDGITSGNMHQYPGSHTQKEANAWWQVDLGGASPIEAVTIWNRTDCCAERLVNYVVKLSDTDTEAAWASPKWQSPKQTEFAGAPSIVPVGRTARYMRIQFVDGYTNFLTLAEVEVWKDPRINLALGQPAKQSSNYNNIASAGRAVDGSLDGSSDSVVSRTNSEANAWWQVDLGAESAIHEIDIWNRTDAGRSWLVNYVIKLSNADTDAAWANPKWTSTTHEVTGKRPTTDVVGQKARYVRIQFVDGTTNTLSLAEVQVWKGREASDFPQLIHRESDSAFTVTYRDGSTDRVPGNLKWDWCSGYLDKDVEAAPGIFVTDLITATMPAKKSYRGQSDDLWKITEAYKKDTTWSDSWGINGSFGYEGKFMGIGAEVAFTLGFGKTTTTTRSWTRNSYFEGRAGYMDLNVLAQNFEYCPYYYLTTSTTPDGVQQAYVVLDYYVPTIGPMPAVASEPNAVQMPQVAPQAPLIDSATHPDPDAWSTNTTATFTWRQPEGDPVTAPLYAWVFDREPDTTPTQVGGPNQTESYYSLPDGTFYLHVRAMNPGGEWSDTAHRRIRIDKFAPAVALVRNPLDPDGNQGWYTVPVTVTASATDAGSGVAALETSTDGSTWAPYAGPLEFTADTPETIIWARASDSAGRVSEPISTTVKVDLSAPDSDSSDDCEGGVCNGGVWEGTSGLAGMEIQVDDGSWTSASILGEALPTLWAYAALLDVGNGYHIINGRAADGAGHVEAPHKMAERIWYPWASPDLSASSLAFEPAVARPGETVTATLTVRNGGFQEGYVAIQATLPAGLAPAEGALASLDDSVTYDPATGVITWPDQLLWPGEFWRTEFQAVVADGLPASMLTAELHLHASWPNVDLLPPEEQQRFRDFETRATVSAGLQVDPQLPAGKDVTAPHVSLTLHEGTGEAGDTVDLALQASAGAQRLYLREWTLNPASGAWITVRSTGWIPYVESLTWELSAGGGVKYLGAWVADAAGNVSRLDERSLAFTNRLIEEDLLAGQRRQYRYPFEDGIAVFNLLTTSGQADLYAWLPGQSDVPTYTAEGSDLVKTLGFHVALEGLYLLEASAVTDTTYTLLDATTAAAAAAVGPTQLADAPQRPLTLTTPLTGGAAVAPGLELRPAYLPMILR